MFLKQHNIYHKNLNFPLWKNKNRVLSYKKVVWQGSYQSIRYQFSARAYIFMLIRERRFFVLLTSPLSIWVGMLGRQRIKFEVCACDIQDKGLANLFSQINVGHLHHVQSQWISGNGCTQKFCFNSIHSAKIIANVTVIYCNSHHSKSESQVFFFTH